MAGDDTNVRQPTRPNAGDGTMTSYAMAAPGAPTFNNNVAPSAFL